MVIKKINLLYFFIFTTSVLKAESRSDIKQIVVPLATPALIDGVLNDWHDAFCCLLNAENGFIEQELPKNDIDFSITFFLKHDCQNLYLAFNIADEFVDNLPPELQYAPRDRIKLYFDTDLDEKIEETKEGFRCEFLPYGNMKIVLFAHESEYRKKTDWAITQTNSGWIAEIKIPFIFFDTIDGSQESPIEPGEIMKFSFLGYDNDPDNINKTTRLSWTYRTTEKLPILGILVLESNSKGNKLYKSNIWQFIEEIY